MGKRPTFFLSSTIHDFRDLRSAIKYSLEARGCRVLASECNDFGGDLAAHSYEACLSAIEQADYFVLLVGARVGGWYDEPNQISITRQEYRTAYARHKLGLLKIVTLVRSEVWQVREDRKALLRHLETLNLNDREKVEVAGYSSIFANNAEFISDFLNEIGRNAETIEAVKTGTGKPTGNWIHVFKDFRDVHDVISPLAFAGETAEDAAYGKALQHELLTILARFLAKIDGTPRDFRRPLREHIEKHPIEMRDRDEGHVRMETKSWWSFSTIMMHTLGSTPTMVVTEDALTSSLFLTYDQRSGAYIQTPAYEALCSLVDELRFFNKNASAENLSIMSEYSPRALGRNATFVDLPSFQLAMLYSLAQRWVNIVSLSIGLIRHLEGHAFEMPTLMPFSPIKGMDEAIAKEAVSAAEAKEALGL